MKFLKELLARKKMPKMAERLTSEEWSQLYSTDQLGSLIAKVKNKDFSPQTVEMLRLTKEGDSVLEIGSGTGETSLVLSLQGRKTTALDFSRECLNLTMQAAQALHCNVNCIYADACVDLPFSPDSFEIVFQAGLLEHFFPEKQLYLLTLWGKAGKRMVSLIPNAASLAYRVGKKIQETNGTWKYGLELPQYSLQQAFLAAGFRTTQEYTIGEAHALNFLPKNHYITQALRKWIQENSCEDNCGQGYLLVTVGEKHPD